ncbi:hypothetical protein Btru_008291 [Bulinus truncatus]|nr:hypothetical protein Btru_008291 [Bulinus truncatus]
MGGGGGHAPHDVPDWKIYKAEGIPQLDRLQRRLGALGLKDPWISGATIGKQIMNAADKGPMSGDVTPNGVLFESDMMLTDDQNVPMKRLEKYTRPLPIGKNLLASNSEKQPVTINNMRMTIFSEDGCWSNVGVIYDEHNMISLLAKSAERKQPFFTRLGTRSGSTNEHSRPDRDEYISIIEE